MLFPKRPDLRGRGVLFFKSARLVARDPELWEYPALALRDAAADRQMHLE